MPRKKRNPHNRGRKKTKVRELTSQRVLDVLNGIPEMSKYYRKVEIIEKTKTGYKVRVSTHGLYNKVSNMPRAMEKLIVTEKDLEDARRGIEVSWYIEQKCYGHKIDGEHVPCDYEGYQQEMQHLRQHWRCPACAKVILDHLAESRKKNNKKK